MGFTRAARGSTPRGSARRLPAIAAGSAVVALAVATLGACTGSGSSSGTVSQDNSAALGGTTVSPAPPGKYKTLPQPCGTVDLDSLKQMVPGAASYNGKESLTYDTDRRVGCSWRGRTSDGTTRALTVDLERVVSYDPAISDEVQAESDFDQQATTASITMSPASGTPTTAPPSPSGPGTDSVTDTSSGTPTGTPGAGTSPGATTGSGADGSSQDLAPRPLTDLGNTAFLNDVLKHPASGPRRDVTVVFRTANVLVSIVYTETVPRGAEPPQSFVLQKAAQDVASQLEHGVEG